MRNEDALAGPGHTGRGPAADRERQIASMALRQHGLITTQQLAGLGFSRHAMSRRVAAGRLHRVHRGVYAVGHAIVSAHGARLGAVLACGDGTLAGFSTAAAIWEVRSENSRPHHVIAGRGHRSKPGIRVHHASDLHPADRAIHNGIPVTSLARTLVDLGAVVSADHVRAAFVRAEQLRLLDMRAIDAALARAGQRPGPAVLREVVRTYDPRWQETRSRLELRLLDALAVAHLPAPAVDVWIDSTYLVDFLWRKHNLIVETVGFWVHATARARRRDARRDNELRGLGYQVLRVPERQIANDPHGVGTRIRDVLRQRRDAA